MCWRCPGAPERLPGAAQEPSKPQFWRVLAFFPRLFFGSRRLLSLAAVTALSCWAANADLEAQSKTNHAKILDSVSVLYQHTSLYNSIPTYSSPVPSYHSVPSGTPHLASQAKPSSIQVVSPKIDLAYATATQAMLPTTPAYLLYHTWTSDFPPISIKTLPWGIHCRAPEVSASSYCMLSASCHHVKASARFGISAWTLHTSDLWAKITKALSQNGYGNI